MDNVILKEERDSYNDYIFSIKFMDAMNKMIQIKVPNDDNPLHTKEDDSEEKDQFILQNDSNHKNTPSSKIPSCLFWFYRNFKNYSCDDEMSRKSEGAFSFRIVSALLISFVILLTILNLGEHYERINVKKASSTLNIYSGTTVCTIQQQQSQNHNNTLSFETFSDASIAHDNHRIVGHCGSCGECSNMNDIHVMIETKLTLTNEATFCALKGVIGGRTAIDKCLDETISFTPGCSKCWADNIECTKRKCFFTCMKRQIIKLESNNIIQQDGKPSLNKCLECDEKLCGPEFIKCAGANRRRLGIISDIIRDPYQEQCTDIDVKWF